MQYYVYEYRHPKTKVPFYVGKGRNRRFKQHLTKSSEPMLEEISKIRDSGLEPEIEQVFFSDSEATALQVEEHLISCYGLRKHGGLLVNQLERSGSNTQVEIPEEVKALLGTMSDKSLSDICGINWSTLRDCRNSLGIKSFRDQTKGTEAFSEVFKRDTNHYRLYNTNNEVVEGNRYEILEATGIDTCHLGSLVSGKVSHALGWFLEKPADDVVTKYTIKTLVHESGDVFTGTYKDFADKFGFRTTSCRNLYAGQSKSHLGWFVSGTKDCRRLPDTSIYTLQNNATGATISGTRKEIQESIGISSGDMANLTSCYQRTSKGWSITHKDDAAFVYIRKKRKRDE